LQNRSGARNPRSIVAGAAAVAAGPRATKPSLTKKIGFIKPYMAGNLLTKRAKEMRLQDYDIRTQFQAAVVSTQRITPIQSPEEVREIVLEIEDSGLNIRAGQNVGVLMPGHEEFGQDHHLRLYSIADVPEKTANGRIQIDLCVRRCTYIDDYSGEEYRGLASNYLCDLQPGDTVTLTGPYGSAFELPPDPDATMILIGAGTGIAPFRAFVKQAYQNRPDFRGRIRLFYGARTGLELLYLNDVKNDFAQYYDQDTFEAISALSQRPHWSDSIDWNSAFKSRSEELWSMLLDPKTHVYVAGLEQIRDELDSEFAKIAGSEEGWAERKAELIADQRWTELLY
jgi:ferredoxin--NADP+ reductase